MDETEKRRHQCCFTGHRPEKLQHNEAYYRIVLAEAIRRAIDHGDRTFISGMARGIDIWAAEEVLNCKREISDLRLICALPHPNFERRWSAAWQRRYRAILNAADLVNTISPVFTKSSYQKRNEWMVRHASLLIAVYNGSVGGTHNTIEFARKEHVEIFFADGLPEEKFVCH